MSKKYKIETTGDKVEVVEWVGEEPKWSAAYHITLTAYQDKLSNATRYATIPSDRDFWLAKQGEVFGEDEFEVKRDGASINKTFEELYAIPRKETQVKPLITQAFNDDGTHCHWRLIDAETGNLLWTENPEEEKHLWVGEVPVTAIPRKEDDVSGWVKVSANAMPKGEVHLYTSSKIVAMGYWDGSAWRIGGNTYSDINDVTHWKPIDTPIGEPNYQNIEFHLTRKNK